MVFKRRNKLPLGRRILEFFWPRKGWKRAVAYVVHRVRRLPDTPDKIARGVAFGIFVSFTPLFGLHFVLAATLSFLFGGNAVAAILATFFGNPLTFPFIAAGSMSLGHWILGQSNDPVVHETVIAVIREAGGDLFHNLLALVTSETVDWTHLLDFWWRVFLPYLVGGVLPGLFFAIAGYVLSKPLITAYKHRRKGLLMARWNERRAKASRGADDSS